MTRVRRALATAALAAALVATAPAPRPTTIPSFDVRPDALTFSHQFEWDIYEDPRAAIMRRLAVDPPQRFEGGTVNADELPQALARRDWSIPKAGLPPYPVDMWILSNDTSWPTLANACVRRMQTWLFSDTNVYDSMSWWQHPVILISYMDLDRAIGDGANQAMVQRIINANSRGEQYIIDAYVDDQAWWGVCLAKAYMLYGGNSNWLSAAKAIQASDESFKTSDCGGGLLWLTYKPDFGKNTVTNTLHISLSALLYQITGDQSYLDDAISLLEWWLGWAYVPSSGKVYDTLTAYDCDVQGLEQFTYDPGLGIGALVDLYDATGNSSYLNIASNMAHAAMSNFSTSIGIMRESCEYYGAPNGDSSVSAADGGPTDDLPAGCQTDTIMFKGILAASLGYLYERTGDQAIYNYLVHNFLSSALYNMDSTFLMSEWWDGPFNKTLANQLTQANAIGLLSAGVSVNIAFENNKLNKSGQPPATISATYSVPLPTGNQNPADTTSLRRRGVVEPSETAQFK